jgi:hypothetical protein
MLEVCLGLPGELEALGDTASSRFLLSVGITAKSFMAGKPPPISGSLGEVALAPRRSRVTRHGQNEIGQRATTSAGVSSTAQGFLPFVAGDARRRGTPTAFRREEVEDAASTWVRGTARLATPEDPTSPMSRAPAECTSSGVGSAQEVFDP